MTDASQEFSIRRRGELDFVANGLRARFEYADRGIRAATGDLFHAATS